ncbi:MAG TPA: protein-methionine-sulfoxide reductase heme-binding subunit MsrQ [Steroidobacteraceae bacterium]|nr:protein-methionine-sulfoxide reductase heme-binding subunit MsrQ [Steroidobacteraceae bacterium]
MDADYRARRYAKPVLFLLCLWPAAWLTVGILALQSGNASSAAALALGVNPVETVQDTLGIWGLRLLLATLAVTPLRVLGGWTWLQSFRRMLGLFAFFYVTLHFLWYLFVDQAFDWRQLAADVVKRPYVTAGFSALLMLIPLAATSTRRAMRRLGRRWQKLHRLVYPAAILGCIHFWWQVKADVREPLVYSAILALLLGWRLYRRRAGNRKKDQKAARAGPPVERLAEQPPGQH